VRAGALSDPEVGEYINKQFVSAWKRVGTFQVIQRDGKTVARAGGNIAIYFCTPELDVVHAIAGPVAKEGLLTSAKWAVDTYRKAVEESKGDREALVAALKRAHEAASPRNRCLKGVEAPLVATTALQVVTEKGNSDRPSPPGSRVYRCVDTEDLARPQEAVAAPPAGCKAEVVAAVQRVEPQVRRRAIALVAGGRGLHGFLAEQGLPKLDDVYRHVFEGVLGQQVTDAPVLVREAPQGRVYGCQSVAIARREPIQAAQVDDIAAKLKAAMDQIEQLKKQIEELKKAQ